jgi:AhpD family alkylhydroperoxidase
MSLCGPLSTVSVAHAVKARVYCGGLCDRCTSTCRCGRAAQAALAAGRFLQACYRPGHGRRFRTRRAGGRHAGAPSIREHNIMATVRLLTDEEVRQRPRAWAVFQDIRATRKSDFINNFWRALAHDPAQLERVWTQLKQVMVAEGELPPLVREMIYIAVSTANGCSYCVHSHTAAARAKGMTEGQHAELLAVIGMAAQTNALVTALQVPVDEAFEVK